MVNRLRCATNYSVYCTANTGEDRIHMKGNRKYIICIKFKVTENKKNKKILYMSMKKIKIQIIENLKWKAWDSQHTEDGTQTSGIWSHICYRVLFVGFRNSIFDFCFSFFRLFIYCSQNALTPAPITCRRKNEKEKNFLTRYVFLRLHANALNIWNIFVCALWSLNRL